MSQIPENTPIRLLQTIVFDNALEKGFHEKPRTGEMLTALLHSEVSELFEEYRDGRDPQHVYTLNSGLPVDFPNVGDEGLEWARAGNKPEGIPIELADIVIRCLDTAEELGIDLDYFIRLKHEYNRTRPHKHGKTM